MQRVVLTIAATLLASWAGSAESAYVYTYSGDAAAAIVDVPLLGPQQSLVATGSLPPGGGSLSASAATVSLDVNILLVPVNVISAGLLQSSTNGGTPTAGITDSHTSLTGLSLAGGLLTSSLVSSDASAFVGGTSGASTVSDLSILGIGSVAVTGDVNQVVNLPGVGTLTINEQISVLGPAGSSIIVNALHLSLLTDSPIGLADIIVGHSYAAVDYVEDLSPVPEPATLSMICSFGLVGAVVCRLRRRGR